LIFDRQIQTRVLCIIVLLSWLALVALIGFGAIYAINWRNETPIPGVDLYLKWALRSAAIFGVSLALLWLWRRCGRCRRRLFAEGRRAYFSEFLRRRPENLSWIRKSWMGGLVERERDYRAKTLLGSYRTAAIVQMALTGRLRCQWCGHLDGEKPDYVVVASDK
jgi:hypothetical protein